VSERTCQICGQTIRGRQRVLCGSVECKRILRRDQQRARRAGRSWGLPPCPECGGSMSYSGSGTLPRFCSERCKCRHHNRIGNRKRLGVGTLENRRCRWCGTGFTPLQRNGVYCSRECYLIGNRSRPRFTPEDRSCANCGEVFTARRYDQKFCSRTCCKRFEGRERARRRRSGTSECDYTDQEIFERDRWQCHLCGMTIRKGLSRMHPRGATIDHLLPLILGGEDVAANVAAAHRECNVAKNQKAMNDQLRLIG
jgi:predicted nucleic acid-binding Zn ribbon protein